MEYVMDIEKSCNTCDNYLGPKDPTVCAVSGCESLSKYCNVGYLQTIGASNGTIEESSKAEAVQSEPEKPSVSRIEPAEDTGAVLYSPRAASATVEKAVPEEPKTVITQKCTAITGKGSRCKRDALPGQLHCGNRSHKKQVLNAK